MVILFDDESSSYLEEKFTGSLAGCTVMYNKDLSNLLNSGARSAVFMLYNNKISSVKLTDINNSAINVINNILDTSSEISLTYNNVKDKIFPKLLTDKSFFVTDNSFGLFDFKRQKYFLYPNEGENRQGELHLSPNLLKMIRASTGVEKIISDTLQNTVIEQTGFPKYAVESINTEDTFHIGLLVRTLSESENQTDSVPHLRLRTNFIIASSNDKSNLDKMFDLDKYSSFYPVKKLIYTDRVLYPALRGGFAIEDDILAVLYNDKKNYFLVLHQLNKSDSAIFDAVPLNFLDSTLGERMIIKLSQKNPVVVYLNSKVLEFPLEDSRIDLQKLDGKLMNAETEILDIIINSSNNTANILLLNKSNVFNMVLNIKNESIVGIDRIDFTNTTYSKYYGNKICILKLINDEYLLQEYQF
ncbi:hypothetical protein FACS189429_5190 [Bacteroidia bacterium]|nr:hypothetical protein FACS189429_5190 [Bacteroidia bacterium]